MSRLVTIVAVCVCSAALVTLLIVEDWNGSGGQLSAGEAASKGQSAAKNEPANSPTEPTLPEVDILTPQIAVREIAETIRRSLGKKVTVEFKDEPFAKALQKLGDLGGFNVLLDDVALEDEGIATDQSITARFRDLPLRQILRRLLRPHKLVFCIRDEVVWITTLVLQELSPRVYDVQSLLESGYEMRTLIDFLPQTTEGMWEESDGTGGRISECGYLLVVRQTEDVHHKIQEVLKVLQIVANPKLKQGRLFLFETEADRRVYAALSRRVSVDFQNVPLRDVLDGLAEKMGIEIVVDQTSLADEGVSPDEPITIRLRDMTLQSVLKSILEPLGLMIWAEDGQLGVEERISLEGLFDAIYIARDLIDAGFSSDELIDTIMYETYEPWVEVDGSGGYLIELMPGVFYIRQTVMGGCHCDVAWILDELRKKALTPQKRSKAAVWKARASAAIETEFYRIEDLPRDDVLEAIPKLVAPESWSQKGGPGTLHVINGLLVVRQSEKVHREVRKFLRRLRSELKWFDSPPGPFDGQFRGGGGFFSVETSQ